MITPFDEHFAGIYETLKRHEKLLFEVSTSVAALNQFLGQNPEIASALKEIREDLMRGELGRQHAAHVSVLDAIIARLRGT